MEIERSNLLILSKLVVRDLIKFTKDCHSITVDLKCVENNKDQSIIIVRHLLTLIEHCLCHGLRSENYATVLNGNNSTKEIFKTTTNVLRRAKNQVIFTAGSLIKQCLDNNPWPVLLHIEMLSGFGEKISDDVLTMTELSTGLGKSRVWLRQALMRKQLGEYFSTFIDIVSFCENSNSDCDYSAHLPDCEDNNRNLSSHYHPGAFLLNEEGVVFTGLLASLKFIDFCFIIKDNVDELNKPLSALPYHIYLQRNMEKSESINLKDNCNLHDNTASVIEQKIFLEEYCNKLKKRMEQTNIVNQQLNKQIKLLNDGLKSLRLDNDVLKITIEQLRRNVGQGDSRIHGDFEEGNLMQTNVDTQFIVSSFTDRIAELEMELKKLHQTNDEKCELIESLRSHLTDSNKRIQQLTRHLSESQTSITHKQTVVKQLETKSKGLANIIDQMNERISKMSLDKGSNDRQVVQLEQQLHHLRLKNEEQTRTIQLQDDQYSELNADFEHNAAELERLKAASSQLEEAKSKIDELELQVTEFRTRCDEQECSLTEMADLVNTSKLEAENLRESQFALRDAHWASDDDNPNCAACQLAFSVSRRRHHCRNCGLIFCHECSSKKLPLPSSSKPERICDSCHNLLMTRYSLK